jgi:hypothetical protein
MFVVVLDTDGKVKANYIFKSYEEAREYVEKKITGREDLMIDDGNVVVFDNDDAYCIEEVSLCEDVSKCK